MGDERCAKASMVVVESITVIGTLTINGRLGGRYPSRTSRSLLFTGILQASHALPHQSVPSFFLLHIISCFFPYQNVTTCSTPYRRALAEHVSKPTPHKVVWSLLTWCIPAPISRASLYGHLATYALKVIALLVCAVLPRSTARRAVSLKNQPRSWPTLLWTSCWLLSARLRQRSRRRMMTFYHRAAQR
jgi:hypothetical protein